ncbi:M23 family metallopeptidase [Rhodococcus sp. IEGM 1379]|uniref:M23 family metallopeptidase n=1 Tax=Rhodococcus sp. IEGM 1379 TaxID=3047086 RepID=UPI0024B6A07D|nr:M23 family metallopeptidase [Rhodococcus sp. IEGM 1379]MDI9915824.1 M23 family metallopeptidase [Rhodococcus sp. IEGM 1379]
MRKAPLILVAAVALLAGCSSSVDSTESNVSPASTVNSQDGVPPGYPADIDILAPLVIKAIGAQPIPVTGADGNVHVAYEISVLNVSPRPAVITRVDTLAGGPNGKVVSSLAKNETLARSMLVPNYSGPFTEIPVGRTAVLMLDDVYDARADVPAEVTHRLTATFGPAAERDAALGAKYPDTVTQIGGVVTTSASSPVTIGPPLAGDGWLAANGCCAVSSHRGALMASAGRINAVERFAIDFLQIDTVAGVGTSTGDGSKNENYRSYDAPLLAVADGTVKAVVSTMPEETPQQVPDVATVDQLGGNYVIIDIGDGNFAFYAHMIPGSASVKVGDKVTRGQVIGKLGNSGNTSEPHLHFQVSRAAIPLSGNNVPYEIDRFTLVGSMATDALVRGPNAGERTNQLPLNDDVVNFPAIS